MSVRNPPERAVLFESQIGWCAFAHCNHRLSRVIIGEADRQGVFERLLELGVGPFEPNESEQDWVQMFQTYLEGHPDPKTGRPVDFTSFEIDESWMTEFQRRCVQACRQIPAGQKVSYGELAKKMGSPNAARAVGTVMRKNRYPLVVPCHRVVAADGIGGFNARSGVALKARLLQLDRCQGGSVCSV